MQKSAGSATRARAAAEFARRARERMARGEPLTVAIGGSEAVLPPDLRHSVLALLEEAAAGEGTNGHATNGNDNGATNGNGTANGELAAPASGPAGLPPLPLRLPAQLTAGQAADLLGVSRATLAQLVDRGELPATRSGPRRRLATADVLAFREAVRARRQATVGDVIAASRDLDLYPFG